MLESAPSHQLADIISGLVNASFKEKMDVLNAVDLKQRFELALPLLKRQIEGMKLLQEKQEQDLRNQQRSSKKQRILQKLQGLRKTDADQDDMDELQDLEVKLSQANLPEKVAKVANKEMRRLKKMSPQMPEYPMLRHYLELIAELPWSNSTRDHVDIHKAREVT